MFESNFSVDEVSYSHNVMYNSFKPLSKGYPAGQRASIFHGTAVLGNRIDAQRADVLADDRLLEPVARRPGLHAAEVSLYTSQSPTLAKDGKSSA